MYWRSQKSSFFSEEQNYKPPFHLPTGLVVIFDLRKLQGVLCTRYLLEGKKGAKNLIISYTYLPSTYYAISDCHFFCKVENRGEWRCNYVYWRWTELKYLTYLLTTMKIGNQIFIQFDSEGQEHTTLQSWFLLPSILLLKAPAP